MDMIKLTIHVVEMNIIIGLMISMVDVQVIKQALKDMGSVHAPAAMKDTIFIVMIAIYSKYFWGNHQNNTDRQQPKQNQFIGRGGMNVYNAGVIHCDYILILPVLQGCIASYSI